jgi:hypothetical protein
MGPSLDLEVRRSQQPPVDLEKEATKQPKLDKKKVRRGTRVGRVGAARQMAASRAVYQRWQPPPYCWL